MREGTASRGVAELESGQEPLGRTRRTEGRKRAADLDPGRACHGNRVSLGSTNIPSPAPRRIMRGTDVPGPALAALDHSAMRDNHVLIRRGPAEAKLTPAELFGSPSSPTPT